MNRYSAKIKIMLVIMLNCQGTFIVLITNDWVFNLE